MIESISEHISIQYERAKKLAEEIWLHGDHEGSPNDFYYFQCGFVAGMIYKETNNDSLQQTIK